MLKIDLKNTICKLVDFCLDRNHEIIHNKDYSFTRPAIIIPIEITADDNNYDERIRRKFKLLFTGNTSVWYTEVIDNKTTKWVNTSNHDSCWRTDGLQFLSKVYFEMCEKIEPKTLPVNVNITAEIGGLINLGIKKVSLTYAYNNKKSRFDVLNIKPVKEGEMVW